MNKFIKRILLFSLPLLLLSIVMEFLLRQIPNDYEYKKEYLDSHSEEIETLILGSSHSFFGINPQYFSGNAFNASHISQSLDYDFEILKRYQARFKNLKTIVLPISYFTLFDELEKSPESWRIKNYVIYYDIKVLNSLIYHSEVLSNRLDVNLKRLSSYYFNRNTNISCSELGWGTGYKSEKANDLSSSGKEAALRHTHENIEILEDNKATLKSMIGLCERNKINVIFLTLPAFETYRKNISNEQFKKTVETATELASHYRNCRYLNLFESSDFKASDFFDADHLNEIGARKLSLMINDTIKVWKSR